MMGNKTTNKQINVTKLINKENCIILNYDSLITIDGQNIPLLGTFYTCKTKILHYTNNEDTNCNTL